ncbi:hypothetical protein BDV96DRAFT_39662 [Lophiotrema nucula]|uniref:Uncharacterized protein n=1 Tax=Lophiotrema nucula TaxID=690887 RepID=A0A6A5ZCL7_9PLEO|nr:hypothetical protein BDV96DRAFT_39662 [Lophiotrema nucula]
MSSITTYLIQNGRDANQPYAQTLTFPIQRVRASSAAPSTAYLTQDKGASSAATPSKNAVPSPDQPSPYPSPPPSPSRPRPNPRPDQPSPYPSPPPSPSRARPSPSPLTDADPNTLSQPQPQPGRRAFTAKKVVVSVVKPVAIFAAFGLVGLASQLAWTYRREFAHTLHSLSLSSNRSRRRGTNTTTDADDDDMYDRAGPVYKGLKISVIYPPAENNSLYENYLDREGWRWTSRFAEGWERAEYRDLDKKKECKEDVKCEDMETDTESETEEWDSDWDSIFDGDTGTGMGTEITMSSSKDEDEEVETLVLNHSGLLTDEEIAELEKSEYEEWFGVLWGLMGSCIDASG